MYHRIVPIIHRILVGCISFYLFGACQEKEQDLAISSTMQPDIQDRETALMVQELKDLVLQGNPYEYYHWNGKLALLLKEKMEEGTVSARMKAGYDYCIELINSGQSEAAIETINNILAMYNKPHKNSLTKMSEPIFELLALAYLRLGEQTNCQNNHTPQSCIVPLQPPGFHLDKTGSLRAIEIYSRLMDQFPSAKYKWLLNVAYMTLGKYPEGVPAAYKLQIPNSSETKSIEPFEDVAMSLGVATNGLSGGVAIDDFDGDGYLDIFATSYGMEDNVRLYTNDQKGGFTDTTEAAGLTGIVSGLNTLQADYNNDGHIDLLILRGAWLGDAGSHPNSLLKNMGDGTYRDVSRSSGILSYHPTQTAAWLDFNNDGNLDLFIGNETRRKDKQHPCELFKNNGDGTFTEVAKEHGLGGLHKFIKGVTAGDINNDGWQDLYLSNLNGENILFQNKEGNFVNTTSVAGVAEPYHSFPCWFWDVNNDGFQDIFVSGYSNNQLEDVASEYAKELEGKNTTAEKPRLYINNQDGTFKEVSQRYGIDKVMYAMGSNFGDLDNDGYLDFYIGTGAPTFTSIVPNRMFKNNDGKTFSEVTSAGQFGHIQKGHGISFADLDQDGDQDIYAVMGGAFEGDTFTNVLFENPISRNNWMVLSLEGISSNRSAIGVRVEFILDNGKKLYRSIGSGGSFGASSLQLEVGLGQAKEIKQLNIYWTGHTFQSFTNIGVNQKIHIKEGTQQIEIAPYSYVPFSKKTYTMHHSKE